MFSVSSKTQYGIRALVFLARQECDYSALAAAQGLEAAVAGATIARSEHISPKFLEGILSQLKNAGLLTSERGKHGGYRLARPASELTMLQIVEALEGEIRPVGCIDSSGACAQGADCLPRLFWCGLKEAVDGYLGSRTLRDIIEGDLAESLALADLGASPEARLRTPSGNFPDPRSV